MRTILFILLPILASGQIYVDSYKFAAPAADLLLDAYPGAKLAYSLRLLDSDYTGDCITVRRSSDNALDTIGFTNGYLDTVSLKTFCGTSASDSCFVKIWWNQADSSGVYGVKYAESPNNAQQPAIMRAGTILYRDGSPSIVLDGSNDSLSAINTVGYINELHNGTAASFFTVARNNSAANRRAIITNNDEITTNAAVGFSFYQNASNLNHVVNREQPGRSVINVFAFTTVTTFLAFVNVDADNATAADRSEIYINAGSAVKNNTQTNTVSAANATYNLRFGYTSQGYLNGSFKEVVIYPTDQSSNRTGIESNVNSFYSIY